MRTRYEDGKRTWAGTRPLWTRSWGGAHIILYSNSLRTCACRLDNIFRSGNIYFGAAIHISEPQYIFQNNNTYFRAPLHISEQHYKFQRRRYAHGEDTMRTRWERQARTVWGRRVRYQAGQYPVWTRYISVWVRWQMKNKTIWPGRFHRLSFKSNGMGPLGLAGAMWQRLYLIFLSYHDHVIIMGNKPRVRVAHEWYIFHNHRVWCECYNELVTRLHWHMW